MPRTTKKSEPVVVEEPKVKSERLTSFESHGQRYFRLTIPREVGETIDSAMRFTFEQIADGILVFTPIVEPKKRTRRRAATA